MKSADGRLFLSRPDARKISAAGWHEISKASARCEGESPMINKPGADDGAPAVSATAPARRVKSRSGKAQNVVVSTFGMERRAGWSGARRVMRPINLERRARFARIETA